VDIGPPLSLSPSSLLAKRLTLKARKPIKFLGFDTLQISDKFQTWLLAFDPNTPPEVINVIPAQWCPDIENDESCKSLQGLSRCLNALAHQKLLARQLKISFLYDIFNHIAAFHQEPKSLCAVPQIAVRGFEDVKFKFYFTRHDKVRGNDPIIHTLTDTVVHEGAGGSVAGLHHQMDVLFSQPSVPHNFQ
jgi:hypothetical protein